MNDDQTILRATIREPELLDCPMCHHAVPVPAVPIPADSLARALGVPSGRLLAEIHAGNAAERAAEDMRRHLATHAPEDWLRHYEVTP